MWDGKPYGCAYYPSIMVKNGYLSRNVPEPKDFEKVLNMRLEAKRTGDKKTADALKLVANTSFGCSNNRYNDMYDPLMAHSICISGQLYLIQLLMEIGRNIPQVVIVNVNTDGLMVVVERKYISRIRALVMAWEETTGFEMEEKGIGVVVQRDVNNYVMRELGGKIKAKGGTLSDYDGGSFKHNSLSVVCRAIVENLLDGVSIEETINNEQDPFAFQMITKAGGTYEKVVHVNGLGEVEVNRTNRVYAGKDERLGAVYKIKADGRRDRIANCPEHAIVDNSGILGVDKIYKQWYIELATKRRDEFLGIKPKRKTRSKK